MVQYSQKGLLTILAGRRVFWFLNVVSRSPRSPLVRRGGLLPLLALPRARVCAFGNLFRVLWQAHEPGSVCPGASRLDVQPPLCCLQLFIADSRCLACLV